MINFKPLEIEDKPIFDKYYNINKYICSEYNFTTLFAWQEMYSNYYAIVENCLVVKSFEGYMYPVGEKEDVKRAFIKLYNECKENKTNFRIVSLTKKMLDEINEFGYGDKFKITLRRDLFDYIYKREKLATLSGKKLHGKKNHYNYFIKNYNYELVDIDDSNIEACEKKLKEIIFERSLNPEKELFATLKVLKYREYLGFISKCLMVDGNIAGIIMSQNHNGTLLIQIAKSDINYRGASVALFKLFTEEYFTECELVNFMEDMGIDGLRKMKLSYAPEYMIEKFLICTGLPCE